MISGDIAQLYKLCSREPLASTAIDSVENAPMRVALTHGHVFVEHVPGND
jgi:hypothetical protein